MVGGYESGYTGMESDVEYDEEGLGDQSDYPYFFEWNGARRISFPTINFDADHVPIGGSMKMCLGVSWAPLKKRNQYDKYLDVRDFNLCEEYVTGRSVWEKEYPKRGLTFKLWEQKMTKGDSYCSNGIYQ